MLLKALVITAILIPLAARAEVGTIQNVGVGSTVNVKRGGSVVRLKAGDDLMAGDEISTDASTAVDIRLEDETLIRLGTSSSYKVQEDSKIHQLMHRLLSGVVRVLVKPTDRDHSDPHIKFRMYTQEGTIGVRGTEFVVTRTAGKTDLKGLDGEVVFGPADTDFANVANFQLVTRGFESSVSAGAKAVAKPEKFDLKKYLDDVNSKTSGPFAPLASAGGSGKKSRYERPAAAKPAVTAPLVAKDTPQPPAPVAASKEAPVAKPKAASAGDLQDLLVSAVLENDEKAAQKALNEGAKINGPSKKAGVTPLQAALSSASSDAEKSIFMFLVSQGADVDAEDGNGLTPLMYAAANHLSMEYVRALVDPGGADYTRANSQGDTATSIAKAKGYAEMVSYLESSAVKADYARGLEVRESLAKKKK